MRATAILMAAALAWASPALAQENPKTKPPSPPAEQAQPGTTTGRSGINVAGDAFVGQDAPAFLLDGSRGRQVQLRQMRGDWVVLVFAERREQVMDLARVASDLKLLGGVFLAVCGEKARSLEKAQGRDPLPFEVAADPTGEVSAMYGAYDRIHSVTTPGVFIIDRRGRVRMSVLGDQLPPEQVLSLAKIPMSASQ